MRIYVHKNLFHLHFLFLIPMVLIPFLCVMRYYDLLLREDPKSYCLKQLSLEIDYLMIILIKCNLNATK